MSYPYPKSLDLPPEHSGDNPCFSGVGIDFTKVLFCRYVHFAETYLLVTVYKKMNFLNVILLYIHVLQLEASSWIQFQMRQHKHVFIVLKDLICKGVISKLYFPIMEVHLLEIICKNSWQLLYSMEIQYRKGTLLEWILGSSNQPSETLSKKTLGRTSLNFYELQTVTNFDTKSFNVWTKVKIIE